MENHENLFSNFAFHSRFWTIFIVVFEFFLRKVENQKNLFFRFCFLQSPFLRIFIVVPYRFHNRLFAIFIVVFRFFWGKVENNENLFSDFGFDSRFLQFSWSLFTIFTVVFYNVHSRFCFHFIVVFYRIHSHFYHYFS